MSSYEYRNYRVTVPVETAEEKRQREWRAERAREQQAEAARRKEKERQKREREEAKLREAERQAKLKREQQEREAERRRQLEEKRRQEAVQLAREKAVRAAARAEEQKRVEMTRGAAQVGAELLRAHLKSETSRLHKNLAALAAKQKRPLEEELQEIADLADKGANLDAIPKQLQEIEAAIARHQQANSANSSSGGISQEKWLAALNAFETEIIAHQASLEKYAPTDLQEIQVALRGRAEDDSGDYAYNLATLKGLQQRFTGLCKTCKMKAAEEEKREEEIAEALVQLQAQAALIANGDPPKPLRERAARLYQTLQTVVADGDSVRRQQALAEYRPQIEKLQASHADWQCRELERAHVLAAMKKALEEMAYQVITMPETERAGKLEALIPGGEMVELSVGLDGSMMSQVVHLVPEGPPTLPSHAEAVAYEQQRDKWCRHSAAIAERLAQQGVLLTLEEREVKSIYEAEKRQSIYAQGGQESPARIQEKKYLREK
jgi:hypothetical protein